MTTCFEAGLAAREFGTHILHVHDLLDWAKSKRLHLRTTPPIDGYEFVHIETLLCAIERHATNLTHAQALLIVKNDPALQARMVAGMGIEQEEFDRYLTESPAWLVQADAHSQWRKTFAAAIKAGELLPLEFGSKLPIVTAPEQSPATPAPDVAASDGPAPLRTVINSTKARRNTLTPVIEQAQKQCTDPSDTAAVWAALLVLAEKKTAPLIGATEEGLQYLKGGTAEIFKRKSLGQRLAR